MIAVTFALPDESAVFLQSLSALRQVSGGALPLYFGTLSSGEVAVLHTGVGPESARARLQAFLSVHAPDFLISAGFAGALMPSLSLGSLVVAVNYSSPDLLAAASLFFQNNPSVFFGSLTSQPVPAESLDAKRALAAATGALAVDMETAALAAGCAAAAVPLLSLRVISDTALQSLPVPFFTWFDPVAQKARPFSLFLYLLAHPAGLPAFYRFVRGVFKAKKNLSVFLKNLIGHLQPPGVVHRND